MNLNLVKFILGGLFMKSTGVVRKIDELGRIVIPIELRRTLDIAEKDALEIISKEGLIASEFYDNFNPNKKKPYVVELWDIKEEINSAANYIIYFNTFF